MDGVAGFEGCEGCHFGTVEVEMLVSWDVGIRTLVDEEIDGEWSCPQTAMSDNFRVECAWELLVVLYCVFGRGVCLSEGFLVGRELTVCFFLLRF